MGAQRWLPSAGLAVITLPCSILGPTSAAHSYQARFKIPNPKVDMEKAIENMRGLPDYLRQIALFDRWGGSCQRYNGERYLSPSDVIDTTGAAVYTIVESVEGVKKAYDIGKKVEGEEEKAGEYHHLGLVGHPDGDGASLCRLSPCHIYGS